MEMLHCWGLILYFFEELVIYMPNMTTTILSVLNLWVTDKLKI
jgi:hypothetical protein